MSASRDDETDSELSKYAPKWSREQPATPDAQRSRYVSTSASKLRLLKEEQPQSPLWPEPVPEPRAREDGLLTLIGRSVKVAAFAALVALLVIFGKPLLQRLAVLEPDSASAPTQVSRAPDRLTANDAPANRARVPATAIAAAPPAAPSATAQAQQAPLSPAQGQQAALSPISKPQGSAIRGVTDSEIRFGISAPFTGPAKELGQNM
ncbi:MAG TPA: hypothetical protein VGU64_04330, partial [Terriglobales bacterium]|nr:hypothetical protein [Terriglobales bacterium]